jgi:hypothetical protein
VVFRPTPLKKHGVRQSWDDEIPFPTVSGKSLKKSSHVPVTTNQYIDLLSPY